MEPECRVRGKGRLGFGLPPPLSLMLLFSVVHLRGYFCELLAQDGSQGLRPQPHPTQE